MPAFETGFAATPAAHGKVFDHAPGESADPAAAGDDFDRVMQATLAPHSAKLPSPSAWRAEKSAPPAPPSAYPSAGGPARSPAGKKTGDKPATKSTAAETKPAAAPTSPDASTLAVTSASAEPPRAFLSLPVFSPGTWGGVPDAAAETAVAAAGGKNSPGAAQATASRAAANATASPSVGATVPAPAPTPWRASTALTAQKNAASGPAEEKSSPVASAQPDSRVAGASRAAAPNTATPSAAQLVAAAARQPQGNLPGWISSQLTTDRTAAPELAPIAHSTPEPAAATSPADAEPLDPFTFAAGNKAPSPVDPDDSLILPTAASQRATGAAPTAAPTTAAPPAAQPVAVATHQTQGNSPAWIFSRFTTDRAAAPEPASTAHSTPEPAAAATPSTDTEPFDPFSFAAWDKTYSPVTTDNSLILPAAASQPGEPATAATNSAAQPASEPMASLATQAAQMIAGGLAQILASVAAGNAAVPIQSAPKSAAASRAPAVAAGPATVQSVAAPGRSHAPAPARQNSAKLEAPANPASDPSPKPAGEPAAATSRDPDATAGGATAPATDPTAPSATAPASENAGTGVAIISLPMKNSQETNKVADPTVKVLPGAPNGVANEQNLPLPEAGPVRAATTAGANSDFALAAADSPSQVSTPAALSSMDLPSLSDTQMRALERAHDMVVLHTMRLVESKSDGLSVIIKPSVGTELSLELRQRGDGVEAQATLTRGDHEFLSQHWPDLQQRLEQRGIKLASLGGETSGDFVAGGHSQFQPDQSPAEEAAQQASAFAEFASSGPSGGASARLAIHDGWESWA